jgi:hypothetical protein
MEATSEIKGETLLQECHFKRFCSSSYIISLVLSGGGRPFHPSVPSSIHPSSSSRKKKMMEEEEEEKLL